MHSTVGFAVKHMVVSTFRGRFEDYDASLTASRGRHAAPQGGVGADSVDVKDENLAAHLGAGLLRHRAPPGHHLLLTLVRAESDELIVDGELTIKGNTRASRPAARSASRRDLRRLEKVGIELEAIVDRTEYGLDWNAPLPKGGVALANEVKLLVDLELAQA